MILTALDQIISSPLDGAVTLGVFSFALLLGLTFHEFSHAVAATLLGDPTPRHNGRLSLNPLAHLEVVGTAMIFLAGFGWAKPVPIDPGRLKAGARTGMALVAGAGPLANIMLAVLAAAPINAGIAAKQAVGFTLFRGQMDDLGGYVVGSVVFWNLLLASFNLLPIAPLDGFKAALGILPGRAAALFARLENFGPGILLLLVASTLMLPGTPVLVLIIRPILNTLGALVLGGSSIWG